MQYIVLVLTIIATAVVAKIFAFPLKKIFKVLLNILIGLILILIINTYGQRIGLHIPFNSVTAIIAGTLGIPGVICLTILNYIF